MRPYAIQNKKSGELEIGERVMNSISESIKIGRQFLHWQLNSPR
jgi:hypothetical protein